MAQTCGTTSTRVRWQSPTEPCWACLQCAAGPGGTRAIPRRLPPTCVVWVDAPWAAASHLCGYVCCSLGSAAGYSYTERGPSGTHFSRFVATDEGNTTELGSVEIIREVGSIGMPRWVLGRRVCPSSQAMVLRAAERRQAMHFVLPGRPE